MKKNILLYFLMVFMPISFCACSDDDPSGESIIDVDEVEKNQFDNWLSDNYVYPYNIDFKYRMEDIESDMNYTLVPATFEQSIKMAKLVKHLCLEVYDEMVGVDFMRSYFPKMIHLVGSPAYKNNGTMILGTAEGGMKITLYNVNAVEVNDAAYLNYFYFKTIHHEFAHILNQTKNYSTDFQEISGKDYLGDSWDDNINPYQQGFVSQYASKEANEDFVEILAIFVTNTEEYWASLLAAAARDDADGAEIIQSKFEIVYNYMLDSWGIDLYEMRSIIQRRSVELGDLDFDNL